MQERPPSLPVEPGPGTLRRITLSAHTRQSRRIGCTDTLPRGLRRYADCTTQTLRSQCGHRQGTYLAGPAPDFPSRNSTSGSTKRAGTGRTGSCSLPMGDCWAGICAVRLYPEAEQAFNVHTGVIRTHRRRRIALALKLAAIRYARSQGARSLSTHNDSTNGPMLALNRKLGYVPEPGRYTLRRAIRSSTSVEA